MNSSLHRLTPFRHYTRWVLVLFVVSVLNMAFQVPVHAAMQQSMQQAVDHSAMGHLNMANSGMDHSSMDHSSMGHDMSQMNNALMAEDECCPPSLCASVDAQHDQLTPSSVVIASNAFDNTIPLLVFIQKDILSSLSRLTLDSSDLQYRQISPPPIQFTTELQI